MPDELLPPAPHDVEAYGDGGRCRYCGAPLEPRAYFCLRCATPYKEPDSVLPTMRPRRPTAGELVRRHAPKVATLWWTYFSVVVGLSLVMLAFSGGEVLAAQVVVMDVALFITTVWFAVAYWPSLRTQLGRLGFDHGAAWAGLGLLAPLLLLNYGYHHWLAGLTGMHAESLTERLRGAGFSQAALVFVMAIFPAVSEEIAFRGLLQHWLQVALRPRRAITLAAALFAAMHLSLASMPILFLAGWLLGWVKWKTGSLYPSMLIHFLHNLAVVMLFDA
jgi:membrane protease YdiL (CAAX protease family)